MPTSVLNVRLNEKELDLLREQAQKHGVPLSTYARMMMLEGIKAQQPAARARQILDACRQDFDLRMALRRLVLSNPQD